MRTLALAFALTAFANDKVDAIFADYNKPGSPGCAVGVLQNGKTVLAKGYGLADLDHQIKIDARSRFYMASVSKQFTSMALLIAEKEGKLSLDDSIRKWVPEMPSYADGITIRRMLDHTSGLRDNLMLWQMRGFSNESVLKQQPTLALIARQKALNFPIGSDYNYSNSGYLLAAIALERATGKTLAQWTKEKIHAPLEMTASRFQDDHGDPVPNRAHGYHRRDGAFKTVDVGFDLVGSGGMYSNIEDMLKWARNFDEQTVGKGLFDKLTTPGNLTDGRTTPGGYALGIINKDGTLSHSGGAAGYSTYLLRVPAKKLTVVCLCNIGGTPVARLAEQTANVFGAELKIERATVPTKPASKKLDAPASLAGAYWSDELETVWRITVQHGAARLHTDGGSFPITGGYQAGAYTLKLTASGFEASAGRAHGIVFTRR
jgi:CubicO group peptidase (beta-lactamase class C family)